MGSCARCGLAAQPAAGEAGHPSRLGSSWKKTTLVSCSSMFCCRRNSSLSSAISSSQSCARVVVARSRHTTPRWPSTTWVRAGPAEPESLMIQWYSTAMAGPLSVLGQRHPGAGQPVQGRPGAVRAEVGVGADLLAAFGPDGDTAGDAAIVEERPGLAEGGGSLLTPGAPDDPSVGHGPGGALSGVEDPRGVARDAGGHGCCSSSSSSAGGCETSPRFSYLASGACSATMSGVEVRAVLSAPPGVIPSDRAAYWERSSASRAASKTGTSSAAIR